MQSKAHNGLIGKAALPSRGAAPSEDGSWVKPVFVHKNARPDDELLAHMKTNIRQRFPVLLPVLPHDNTAIFVAGGPSLPKHIDEIIERSKDPSVNIFTSNFTYNYLLDHGVIPWGCVLMDPLKYVQQSLDRANSGTIYFVSTQCMPGVFDALKGKRVIITHTPSGVEGEEEARLVRDPPPQNVWGGSTVGVRFVCMSYILGFRRVEYYAMDSCFDADTGKTYAYESVLEDVGMQTDGDWTIIETDDGRTFFSEPGLASQAVEMLEYFDEYPGHKVVVHGDSLTSHLIKAFGDTKPKFPRAEYSPP